MALKRTDIEISQNFYNAKEIQPDQTARWKSIDRKALISLISSYFLQFFSKGIGAVTRIILARLIIPSHWGVYAEAVLILTLVDTFRDLGISTHLVREKDPPYGNALIIEVFVSLLFLLAIQGVAPYFVFLGAELPNVLRVLFLAGVIQAIACIPEAHIHKELLLQTKITPSVLNILVFSGVSILLAWEGFGIWSLVVGQLSGKIVYALFLWRRVLGEITLKFTLSRTSELIKGSRYLLFMAMLGVIASQIDYGIVGTLLSEQKAGYYFMAFSLVLYPSAIIEPAIHNVVYPAFAHYQHDEVKLGKVYLLVTSSVMVLEVPIYTWIFFNAPILVKLLLGQTWLAIVPLVRILSFLPIIDPFSIFGQVLLKATKQDKVLSIALVTGTLVLVFCSIFFTKEFGLYGTAAARYIILGNLLIIASVQRRIKQHFFKLTKRLTAIYAVSFATIGVIFLSIDRLSIIGGLVGSLFGVGLCWFFFYIIFFKDIGSITTVKQILFSRA